MRKILFIVILLISPALYAQYNFYKIEYYYNPIRLDGGGEFRSYKISLNAEGKGKIIYTISYDTSASKAMIHEFDISAETKSEINKTFNNNNIIETENQFKEEKEFENIKENEFARVSYTNIVPEGSERPVVVKTMSTPVFPKDEIKERLRVFYEAVRNAVPKEIWEKIEKK